MYVAVFGASGSEQNVEIGKEGSGTDQSKNQRARPNRNLPSKRAPDKSKEVSMVNGTSA